MIESIFNDIISCAMPICLYGNNAFSKLYINCMVINYPANKVIRLFPLRLI